MCAVVKRSKCSLHWQGTNQTKLAINRYFKYCHATRSLMGKLFFSILKRRNKTGPFQALICASTNAAPWKTNKQLNDKVTASIRNDQFDLNTCCNNECSQLGLEQLKCNKLSIQIVVVYGFHLISPSLYFMR